MTLLEICDQLENLIGALNDETKREQWEWGEIAPKTDEEHVEDFRNTLRKTREHFNLDGPVPMHGCFVKGTDLVLCHTGTNPGARDRARFIASTDPLLISILIAYVREKESVTAQLQS